MKKIFCLIIIVLFDLSIYHNILACAPVEDFPDNEIDTDCSISLFDHSCAFTKTETRYVRWPGKEDIFSVRGWGSKGEVRDGNCYISNYNYCWPKFNTPVVDASRSY